MTAPPSSLWQAELPPDIDRKLAELFRTAAARTSPVQVFFRADDIGEMDSNFIQMMQVFAEHAMPLCPALVPQWLTAERWQRISALPGGKKLLCWHQHGFAHVNHEQAAKKNEFGDSRSSNAIQRDILAGRVKLEQILGDSFTPVFTPPWNRCSAASMQILQERGFYALSRSINVEPPAPAGMPDLKINIDLHTRRETDPQQGMENLLTECSAALASGRMGFMLHHQRMNTTAFLFLEHLFTAINDCPGITPCTFRELLEDT